LLEKYTSPARSWSAVRSPAREVFRLTTEPTDWRLDPRQFREAVVRQWPDAEVKEVTDPLGRRCWDLRLDVDGRRVDGTLSRGRHAR